MRSDSAEGVVKAIRSACPGLDVDAEVQKQSFGRCLCVVIRDEQGTGLDADQARDIAQRAWAIAREKGSDACVLVSAIDSDGGEWLVDDSGTASRL
jgi:hypothetical protein